MATEVVRRIQIVATQQGVPETTAGLKNLAAAQAGVVSSSSTSEKATLSVASAYQKYERQLDANMRAAEQFSKTQKALDQALQQGLTTAARHAELSALNSTRFGQQGNAAKSLSVITEDLNNRVKESAGSFGVAGQALAALGPIGLGVAAVLGATIGAVYAMSEAAHALAEKAKEIREFSEATGLTTTQFQALQLEASKFGIAGEQLSAGLSKFTAGFNELRLGNGQLLTDIRKINPALADQMQQTTNAAAAFTLFGKAVAATDDIFQRNALLKAGLGKGSAVFGALFESAPDVAALGAAFEKAGRGLDENLIKKLSVLNVEISKTKEEAGIAFASVFAESVLTAEKKFADVLLDIAKSFKAISESSKPSWLDKAIAALPAIARVAFPLVAAGVDAAGAALAAGRSAYDSSFHGTSPANNYSTFQGAGAGEGAVTPEAVKTVEALTAGYKNYVAILGSAATPTEKLTAAIAELELKAKDAGNDGLAGLARGIAGLKLDDAVARQNAHNSALGQSATVTDLVTAKTLELAKAQQQGAGLTQAQIENQKRLTASQALGTFQIDAQTDAEKVKVAALFKSTEAAIAYEIVQTKINEAIAKGAPRSAEQIATLQQSANAFAQNKVAADRLTEAMHLLRDSAASFASGFVKDLAAGQPAIKALQSALASLASTLVDAAIKPLVTKAIDSVAEAIGGAASGAAGATASATILTTAGTTLAGQMVAGATQAAGILTGSGAAAGTEVATGGGAAGTEVAAGGGAAGTEVAAGGGAAGTALAAGGTAAAIAILGPLALLLAAVAAAAAAIGLGNSSAAEENRRQVLAASQDRSLGYLARAQLAGVDTSTREGALQAQEIQFAEERRKDGGDGIYRNGALVAAQEAERLKLIKEWDAKDLAELNASNEAKAAAEKQALEESLKRQLSYQDRLFAATTDTSTLAGALAAFDRKSNQERVDEMAAGGQAINDLVAAQEAERLNIYKQFADAAAQQQKEAADAAKQTADETAAYVKGVAKSINDFLQGLKTGANSILNPQDRLAAAQSLFNSQLGLAKTGDKDALSSITQTAQALLDQAKAFYASGSGYVQVYNAVTSSLTNLGYRNGGLIPGYDSGGMVANGIFGVDSVLASFAGGGNIALAGGEFVMPAAQTRTHLPQLEAMRSGASNDNAISSLGQQLVRAMVGVSGVELSALREDNAGMRALLQRLISAVQSNKPPVPRPGSETRPKAA